MHFPEGLENTPLNLKSNKKRIFRIPCIYWQALEEIWQMGTGKLNSQLVITPLHGWLNILKLLEKTAYLLIACRMRKRFKKWSKGQRLSKFLKEVWKNAKYELQRRAKKPQSI